MIKVNGDELEYSAGMTVKDVLVAKKYSFPLLIVKVNGIRIHRENFKVACLEDGAEVQVIHLMSGG